MDRVLNHDSGLAGLSGTSGDVREILRAIDEGNERAALALEVFAHRVRQGIASMAASMGGIDALVFTGGIGENSSRVRAMICNGLEFLGIGRLSSEANEAEHLSSQAAPVRVFVIPAKENWVIAQECLGAILRDRIVR